jgi:hypothetical protein
MRAQQLTRSLLLSYATVATCAYLQASSVSFKDRVEGIALLLTTCSAHADQKLLQGPKLLGPKQQGCVAVDMLLSKHSCIGSHGDECFFLERCSPDMYSLQQLLWQDAAVLLLHWELKVRLQIAV